MCNGHVLQTDAGLIAIDAPAGFASWLASRFPDKAVTHLLITHMHFDHIEDAALLQSKHQCTIHAHSKYENNLTLLDMANQAWGMNLRLTSFEVDDVLGSKEGQLDLGNFQPKYIPVPGHSSDSMCYYFEELSLLFSGDVLFAGSIGRTDFPGGSLPLLLKGIEQSLLVLPPHTIVYAGHGPSSSIGEERLSNPYLT